MPVHTIPLNTLSQASPVQLRTWCRELEAGGILYFPRTPVAIPVSDVEFLLSQQQSSSNLHKNIAYKPDRDKLSGVDEESAGPLNVERMREIMQRYAASVDVFLADFLAPYQRRWLLDYASFRPLEEKGRSLPMRRRNDLLHIDSFPTRPTRGWRILRFFHNIHPNRTRDWVVGEPFARVVGAFAPAKLAFPRSDGPVARLGKHFAQATGIAGLVPQFKRTPYDEFMMRLHNTMKEDAAFQSSCARAEVRFAPGSSWMVYTETVPHAVLGGQYALEQTFLVDPEAMMTRESTPLAILEKMTGAKLV
jgi:3-deoxy-D-manno-oct-2-ulosonic acid (Kdo) hydroxylase